jgi:hypothetical protein
VVTTTDASARRSAMRTREFRARVTTARAYRRPRRRGDH